MKIFKALKNDYFHLFVKRESRVVLGNKFSNLWLLTAVLTAAFLAVAFSNASLNYLSYKMNDPFINWVDIPNSADINEDDYKSMVRTLKDDAGELKSLFHYNSIQEDLTSTMIFSYNGFREYDILRIRFFESLDIPLVKAIIDESNVVNGWSVKSFEPGTESIGVIITYELMKKMGYEEAPSYIYCLRSAASRTDSDNFRKYYCTDLLFEDRVPIPIPVLAVVNSLPGDFDMVAGSYLAEQWSNKYTEPFNICKEDYARDLRYFVPNEISANTFSKTVSSIADRYASADIKTYADGRFYAPELLPFRDGYLVVVEDLDSNLSYEDLRDINNAILAKYGEEGVHRVYDYAYSDHKYPYTAFVSLYFNNLDKLTDFEQFLSQNYGIKIEMAQINAKQNFNAVSVMGNTLSWVIIIFAIICIVLFIVNLLQSYFQKVKRNIGTFKAFGISNHDLILVYVLIMAAIIISAVVVSISITWLVQGGLHVCEVLKDGRFDYLSLWNLKTIFSIVIIIFVSIFTVAAVMHKLLRSTPGDLIYDRQ